MNPECAAGKHPNCDGKAWRDDLDDIGPCQCTCHTAKALSWYDCAAVELGVEWEGRLIPL